MTENSRANTVTDAILLRVTGEDDYSFEIGRQRGVNADALPPNVTPLLFATTVRFEGRKSALFCGTPLDFRPDLRK